MPAFSDKKTQIYRKQDGAGYDGGKWVRLRGYWLVSVWCESDCGDDALAVICAHVNIYVHGVPNIV